MEGLGFTKKQAVIGGLLVSYYEKPETAVSARGAIDRPPRAIIFLHGWRSQASLWLPVARGIAGHDAIYAIDLPGFGASEMPRSAFTVSDYASIVKDFIAALDLKRVVVIGHSFGGRVAIKLAALHPLFLLGIVLVDSGGFADSTFAKRLIGRAARPFRPVMRHRAMQGIRRSFYRAIGAEDYVATPELTKIYLNIIKEDLTESLRMIRVPTMIVWGSNDTETPVAWAARMQALIPGSEVTILHGAGHFSFLEDSQNFVVAIRRYLSSLPLQ